MADPADQADSSDEQVKFADNNVANILPLQPHYYRVQWVEQ